MATSRPAGAARPGLDKLMAGIAAVLDEATAESEGVSAGLVADGRTAEAWDVLARARLEALTALFPGWRIWLDRAGWHARRRSDGYLQAYQPGAPVFHVRAANALDLAAELCWQEAADQHAPEGCPTSPSSPRWGGLAAALAPMS
jgi:hypothetical protein